MYLPYIHNSLNYGGGVWTVASAAENAVTIADGVTVVEMGRPPCQGLYRIVMQIGTTLVVDVPEEHQHVLMLVDGAAVVEYDDRNRHSELMQLGDAYNFRPYSHYTLKAVNGVSASLLVVHGLNAYTMTHTEPDMLLDVWRKPLL